MRKFGQYLLANPVRAMIAALLCAALPLVSVPGGFIAGILVGFVTLSRGYKTGLLVLAGVAIPIVGITVWAHTFIFDLILLRCILVWAFAGVLRGSGSWRLILEIMTVVGLLAVFGFHLAMDDVHAWWLTVLTHYASWLNTVMSSPLSAEQMQQLLAQLAPMATGLFTGLILVGVFCQLLVARWWQASLFRPGELGREFVEIRNGPLLAVVFTLVLIARLMGVAIAADVLPILLVPFAIGGLSLLHKWVRYKKGMLFLLVVIYLGLVFLPVIAIGVLALAGYVDSWYDLRKRFLVSV